MPFALYERRNNIGLVTLNRPERLNAISGHLLADFEVALQRGFADAEAAVLVLTGTGRAFCAGDDLKEFTLQTESEQTIRAHVEAIQRITRILLGSDKPVVGAVHGYAVGGGFEWMLNCDLVVAAEDLVAFFPELNLGHFVTGGVTHLLPRAVGYQRAMELFLLGERQSAARLERLGLVNFVVATEAVLDRALAVAGTVATKSRWAAGKLKMALNQQLGAPLWQAVDLEQEITIAAFQHPDTAQRVKKAFGEKQ